MARVAGWLVSADPAEEAVFVRYHADIWVEVSVEGEVVAVVVDSEAMAEPVAVVRADGSSVSVEKGAAAVGVAQAELWPSWDYGPRPVGAIGPADGVDPSP